MPILNLKTFQDIANYPTPSDIDAIVVHGHYDFGDGGFGHYKRVASQPTLPGYGVSATGAYFDLSESSVSLKHFGARGDGIADDTAAVAAAFAWLEAKGGAVTAENLKLKMSSEVVFDTVGIKKNWEFIGKNTVVIPTSAITGSIFRAIGSSPPHKGRMAGFTFDLRNNTTTMAGISKAGTAFVDIQDNVFVIDSNVARSAESACILLDQSAGDDPNTGNFWSVISGNAIRPYSGMVDHDNWVGYGIKLVGAQNAAIIKENSFTNVKKSVGMKPSATGYLANAVMIKDNWFETVEHAVYVEQEAGGYWPTGLVINGNRYENIATFLEMHQLSAGIVNNHSQPPTLFANANGSATNYIVNASNALINVLDSVYFGRTYDMSIINEGNIAFKPTGNVVYSKPSGASDWVSGHMMFGNYHLWVNGSGELMIKNGAPANDADGTVVGTQT